MRQIAPHLFESAVAAICPDIEARVAARRRPFDEKLLWWELSCCILSSQVPYPLAVAAADIIDIEGLMLDRLTDSIRLTQKVTSRLRAPMLVHGRYRAYRFPTMRGAQLARARIAVTRAGGSLEGLIAGFGPPNEARNWLVAHIDGLGPKQASMFLRNIGVSYDLAVLDRHVLKYMSIIGMCSEAAAKGGFALYRKREVELSSHALKLGFPVGLLDWAIWIVMRASSQIHYNTVIQ